MRYNFINKVLKYLKTYKIDGSGQKKAAKN